MLTVLVLMGHLGAPDDLAPRLEVLRKHFDRLQAVTVAADAEAEKTAKLAELKTAVDARAQDEAAYNTLYLKMDNVRTWLLAHAAERPARAEGSFEDADDAWIVRNGALEFRWNKADGAMTVKTPAETWEFRKNDDFDVELRNEKFSFWSARKKQGDAFITGYSVGMILDLADFPEAPDLRLCLTVNLIGSEIVFELAAPGDTKELDGIRWPKSLVTGNTPDDFAVIPHMQGMLLPGDWPERVQQQDLCNSRSLYMPWWGQTRNGHGVLSILETSDDGGAEYLHQPGGPTRIQPRWYATLGKVGYLRAIRYVFDDNATYVTMAKRYRRYVREGGRFVSLEEKRVRTPALDRVIGRPVIHLGALYHFVQEASLFNKERIENNHALVTFDELAAQLRQLKASGIDSAYVHLDGWGFYGYDNGHPDVLPVGQEQGGWEGLKRFADTCAECNYLFAVHDQYRDFYLNAASFDERLTRTNLDGSRDQHSVWCGGPQTILSARFAPGYVRRNHDLFAQHGIPVEGAYLDVLSVVPNEESAQPAHPMTRAECARYRRECFDLLRARGYVVSSEEPSDYLVSHLDLVHHGPYATQPNLGGGNRVGIPIPLFNLVYHDSLLTPWDMGDDGGWGIPDGDAGRLHCVLNAGLPYVGPGADEAQIARVKEAAALSQRCATQEMVNHEFLDGSRRKQRSTFADGTTVAVDFDAKTYAIEYK